MADKRVWSLHEGDEFLEPLKFSNGKTQEDVVKEVIKAIKDGNKIIFIKGVCGTGKSAIALNLAKEVGKASIVVPIKNLQKQYELDYTDKKYLLKDNGDRLKISIITGRQNHKCPFLEEQDEPVQQELEEKHIVESDTTLDIFDKPQEIIQKTPENISYDISCNNSQIPCKIEIKDKNIKQIKKYLRQNKKINMPEVLNINHIRRLSIAPVCPYWSPIVPSEIDLSVLKDAFPKDYEGLLDRTYTIYQRKSGCGYCDQFKAYLNSDVLIFNSHKYKLETVMNRKPATEIEIIDECDEFLDSFSNFKTINLNRLNYALGTLFPEGEKITNLVNDLEFAVKKILKDKATHEHAQTQEIIPLKNTEIFPIVKSFLDSNFMQDIEADEENYCYHCDEVARTFEDFFEETYVSFSRDEKDLVVKLVTTNLEKRLREIIDKNKVMVMMSGTLHSENVLKDIFGLKDFKVIEAETQQPGIVDKLRTGNELNCKYANFQSGFVTRNKYLEVLQECIEKAKPPTLIHVNSFKDLPTEQEKKDYNLNLMSQEKLRQIQTEDSVGELVEKFKRGETDKLYTTKCNRGVDFPGKTCNSVVLTKYPYPNVSSLFWKILKQTRPQYYSEFYLDKSKREFLQKVYRALRSKEDHVYLLSPDIRIFAQVF